MNNTLYHDERNDIAHAQIMELRNSMQSKALQPSYQQSHQQQQSPDDEQILTKNVDHEPLTSPIWLPRHQHNQSHESLNSEHILSKPLSADDEEADTDLETDRLLGQQRLDDHGFYDDKVNALMKISMVKNENSMKSAVFCRVHQIGAIVHVQ